MGYQLSICAEAVYPELPFAERVAKIAEAGFRVEFWKWREHKLDIFSDESIHVSSFVGSGAGSMVDAETSGEFIAETKEFFPVARQIGCRSMILLAGELGPRGEVIYRTEPNPITRWITAHKTLTEIAALAGTSAWKPFRLETAMRPWNASGKYSVNGVKLPYSAIPV